MLQIAAFVMARRLARRRANEIARGQRSGASETELEKPSVVPEEDSDSDGTRDPPPGWRKKANLRMYTILDKIF